MLLEEREPHQVVQRRASETPAVERELLLRCAEAAFTVAEQRWQPVWVVGGEEHAVIGQDSKFATEELTQRQLRIAVIRSDLRDPMPQADDLFHTQAIPKSAVCGYKIAERQRQAAETFHPLFHELAFDLGRCLVPEYGGPV